MTRALQWFRVGNETTYLIVCGRRAALEAERELRALGYENVRVRRDGDPARATRPAGDEDGPGFEIEEGKNGRRAVVPQDDPSEHE